MNPENIQRKEGHILYDSIYVKYPEQPNSQRQKETSACHLGPRREETGAAKRQEGPILGCWNVLNLDCANDGQLYQYIENH